MPYSNKGAPRRRKEPLASNGGSAHCIISRRGIVCGRQSHVPAVETFVRYRSGRTSKRDYSNQAICAERDREPGPYRIVEGRSQGCEHTQCPSDIEDHDGAWTRRTSKRGLCECGDPFALSSVPFRPWHVSLLLPHLLQAGRRTQCSILTRAHRLSLVYRSPTTGILLCSRQKLTQRRRCFRYG